MKYFINKEIDKKIDKETNNKVEKKAYFKWFSLKQQDKSG